ncbi:MAG: UDP-N-acetylmuramoyl-L-alanyl-D-glutamate--2,6-diaminopimelate ligase [Planctomycetota bacterium]
MKFEILLHKLKENKVNYSPLYIPRSLNYKDTEIRGASLNSKNIKDGWLFLALKGTSSDGVMYIKEAIQNGAIAVLTQSSTLNLDFPPLIPIIHIPDIKQHLNILASLVYDVDENDFFFIGITGTNGKTTTAYIIEYILNSCNIKCAKLGTVEYKVLDYKEKSSLTTPDIFTFYNILKEAKKRSVKFIVMEVTSHSLVQGRINISNFKHSIFTNIGHDHLDYHKNMEEYLSAKLRLFKFMNKNGLAIINVDDRYSDKFISVTPAKVITYGKDKSADAYIFEEQLSIDKTSFCLQYAGNCYRMNTGLIGLYNIYNTVCAFISCSSIIGNTSEIIKVISDFRGVPGRLEKVDNRKCRIYIDYAHTPEALQSLLGTLKTLKDKKSRLICVFGCGGDRDKEKRPIMGKIATLLSDMVIITSDNPRSENPEDIILDIKRGITNLENVYDEVDRKKAIKKAIDLARYEDIIVIAGKGHEDYQIFKDKAIYFSDKETVLELLS